MTRLIDRSKSKLRRKGFLFPPFYVEDPPTPLRETEFDDDEELIVIERGGVERGFLVRQIAYHHMAQGQLAGEPYLVSF